MSKKTQQYTQVKISRPTDLDEDGLWNIEYDVVWIPSGLAKVGKRLSIRQADDTWQDNWTVQEKYSTMEATYVESHERDYLHQREASDI